MMLQHLVSSILLGGLSILSMPALLSAAPIIRLSIQSGDEAAIRSLVERVLVAYQNNAAGDINTLWSDKTPSIETRRAALQNEIAAPGIRLSNLSVSKITMNGNTATVRVVASVSHVVASDTKQNPETSHANLTFYLVREDAWRLSEYKSSEEDLAARIAAAGTGDERRSLLDSEKELQGVKLNRALIAEGVKRAIHGDLTESLSIFELVQEVAARGNDRSGLASALEDAGNVLSDQGRFAKAMENYQKSLSIREELGDKVGSASARWNIGSAYDDQGDYSKAIEYFNQSLKTMREIGDQAKVASLLTNLGVVYWRQGSYGSALRLENESLEISHKLGDRGLEGKSLMNIGIIQGDMGDHLKALECFQKSLAIKEATADKGGIANALRNIGDVESRQGNYELALTYFAKSLNLYQEMGAQSAVAELLVNMGDAQLNLANYGRAMESYQQALQICNQLGYKQELAWALNGIGTARDKLGDHQAAILEFQKSLQILEAAGNKRGTAIALGSMAAVYDSNGDFAKAIEMSDRAASLARDIGSPGALISPLVTAGKAYRKLGKTEQAKQAFSEAIGAIEETRNLVAGPEQQRQSFMASKTDPFYWMAAIAVGDHRYSDAFSFAERARARTLLDVIESGKIDIDRAMSTEEKEAEEKLKGSLVSLNAQIVNERAREPADHERLTGLNTRLKRTRLEYEAFQTRLYAAHPELRIQRAKLNPITVAQCNDLLRAPDAAILEYLVSDDVTYLFLLSTSSGASGVPDLKVFTIATGSKSLGEMVERFRARLENRAPDYAELATRIYDLILRPAATSLRGKKDLLIVPDGPLWDLPFQALQTEPGRFLIENFAISLAPSLTALREMSRERRGSDDATLKGKLMAMGNPAIPVEAGPSIKASLMGPDLGPLPEAEQQVNAIAMLYGQANSVVYLGAEATEDRVKSDASNYSILHFATHGILNDASPLYSQIVLSRAKDSPNDGLLEAWEIMKLNLKADLVVLSACETARGRVSPGEGEIGLSWAFFVAGCPSTLVSQWKVPANSTTDLMVEFHKNLLAGMTKARALRSAELKLLRSGGRRDPFYWGGFVVIGSGG